MKRKIFLLVAALATLLLTGCDKIRQIKVTGCSLVGNVFGTFSADPITVRAKTAAVYPLNCSAALSSEVSLGEILKLARSYDLAEFTVDVEALIRLKSGIAKRFKLKDLNVKEMLE